MRHFEFSFLTLPKFTRPPISVLIHFHLNKMIYCEVFEFKTIINLTWCCALHPLLYYPAKFRIPTEQYLLRMSFWLKEHLTAFAFGCITYLVLFRLYYLPCTVSVVLFTLYYLPCIVSTESH